MKIGKGKGCPEGTNFRVDLNQKKRGHPSGHIWPFHSILPLLAFFMPIPQGTSCQFRSNAPHGCPSPKYSRKKSALNQNLAPKICQNSIFGCHKSYRKWEERKFGTGEWPKWKGIWPKLVAPENYRLNGHRGRADLGRREWHNERTKMGQKCGAFLHSINTFPFRQICIHSIHSFIQPSANDGKNILPFYFSLSFIVAFFRFWAPRLFPSNALKNQVLLAILLAISQ
jgi:hypothetical protein